MVTWGCCRRSRDPSVRSPSAPKEGMAGAPLGGSPCSPPGSLAMMHFSSCVVPGGGRAWEESVASGASVTLYKDLYIPV